MSSPDAAKVWPGIEYCDAGRGIRLAYESFGAGTAGSPPILLIMGLSTQMLAWPAPFCEMLAKRTGLRVVRFDNRDVGLSTHMHEHKVDVMRTVASKDWSKVPYVLKDLADDAAALIRHLATPAGGAAPGAPVSAHVVGASLGGMIAQELTINHPQLVCSLTSMMSTCDSSIGAATPEAQAILFMPPATDRASAQERMLQVDAIVGSGKTYPTDKEALRHFAGLSFDRSFDPLGGARQFLAICASPARTERLASVRCPTLVLHGEIDPLIQVAGGEATAKAIPGSVLRVLPGWGHDFPMPVLKTLVDNIADIVRAGSSTAVSKL